MMDVERSNASWTFWTSPDSCQASLAIVPFGAESAGNGQTMDDDDIIAITNALGYRPVQSIQFDNACGSDISGHRELAQFAASFAAEHAGVIDVGRVDIPVAWPVHRLHTGRSLLGPVAFAEWSRHSSFHLEK